MTTNPNLPPTPDAIEARARTIADSIKTAVTRPPFQMVSTAALRESVLDNVEELEPPLRQRVAQILVDPIESTTFNDRLAVLDDGGTTEGSLGATVSAVRTKLAQWANPKV